MSVDNCQPMLSKSELSLLVKVLRNELGARQRWLDISTEEETRKNRPVIPSLSRQKEEYSNLSQIYRQLRTLEKQITTAESN